MQNGDRAKSAEMPAGYRPDIDGLRAVAVLLVVLYHAGVRFTRGGFVGVDVFFVISGYLITTIIAREIEAGQFSLLRFYERRARRIFPALAAVLAFSAVVAPLVLFPGELKYFGQSLLAAAFFSANILFFYGQGYFAGTAETVPLLHTWSLAVEEQFYIVYPLALLLGFRKGRTFAVRLLGVLMALSFASSLYLVAVERAAAFFLLPPRAWELLLGALVALGAVPRVPERFAAPLANLALAAVIVPALVYSRNVVFPGWTAAIPCLGAAALIHIGAGAWTPVHRLLSSHPMVHIGLISYSLYLWHWPLIVFYRAQYGYALPNTAKVGLIFASLVAAHFSWRWIERPYRFGRFEAAPIYRLAVGVAAVFASFAALFVFTGGLPGRYPEAIRPLVAFQYDPSGPMREGSCFISRAYSMRPEVDPQCLAMDPARRNVLILGDSHAAHLWAGLAAVFPEINMMQATASGCKPVIGATGASRCTSVMADAFNRFIPTARPETVILLADWDTKDIEPLERTIAALKREGLEVIVMGPIVSYGDLLPHLLARAAVAGDPGLVERARRKPVALDAALRSVSEAAGARYVSVLGILCPGGGECTTRDASGAPIQHDTAHLTSGGAALIAAAIRHLGVLDRGIDPSQRRSSRNGG